MYEKRLQASIEERLSASQAVWEKDAGQQRELAVAEALHIQRQELAQHHQLTIDAMRKQYHIPNMEQLTAEVWQRLRMQNEQELPVQGSGQLAALAKVSCVQSSSSLLCVCCCECCPCRAVKITASSFSFFSLPALVSDSGRSWQREGPIVS